MATLAGAVLMLGAVNAFLRPITARLKLREERELFERGDVIPGTVGAANVVAPRGLIERWQRLGISPDEITYFEAARKRWEFAHQGGLV